MGGRAGMASSGRRPVLFDTRVASADNARSRRCEMQYAIFLERVTRNGLALNLSVFSNVRRMLLNPEMVEPDHNLRLRDRGYVHLERKGRVWVRGAGCGLVAGSPLCGDGH